jgi:hypothetical protein
MNQTVESKNKALVVEAFDTLFNKRDYGAAELTRSNTARTLLPVVGPVRPHQKPSTDSQI